MKKVLSVFGLTLVIASLSVAQKPEDPPCQSSCARTLAAAMAECKGDSDCRADAREEFESCMDGCSSEE